MGPVLVFFVFVTSVLSLTFLVLLCTGKRKEENELTQTQSAAAPTATKTPDHYAKFDRSAVPAGSSSGYDAGAGHGLAGVQDPAANTSSSDGQFNGQGQAYPAANGQAQEYPAANGQAQAYPAANGQAQEYPAGNTQPEASFAGSDPYSAQPNGGAYPPQPVAVEQVQAGVYADGYGGAVQETGYGMQPAQGSMGMGDQVGSPGLNFGGVTFGQQAQPAEFTQAPPGGMFAPGEGSSSSEDDGVVKYVDIDEFRD